MVGTRAARAPVFLLALAAAVLRAAPAEATGTEIFVSTAGDDTRSGASPAQAVATIGRAQELVRHRADCTQPTTVTVGPGTYVQPEAVVLGQADGGDSEASRVTWRGGGSGSGGAGGSHWRGGATVLSFGHARVPADAAWKAAGGGRFELQLPAPGPTGSFGTARPRQLWEVHGDETKRRM
eukprot:SAG22_NODE_719_length_7666_cov_5.819083_5_plen_181_part_00